MKTGTIGAIGIILLAAIGVMANITDPFSDITTIELILSSILSIMMAALFAELFNTMEDEMFGENINNHKS